MTIASDDGTRTSFWRLIACLGVAGVAMGAAAPYCLSLHGPLTLELTTSIEVFISILLGAPMLPAADE